MALDPEERFQVFLCRRLDEILPPDVDFWAVEHGTKGRGTPLQRAIQWQRLLNKGVRPGIVDLHFSWPGHYGVLELKWGKNKPTDEQIKFLDRRRAHGHYTGVAWLPSQVEDILRRSWRLELSGTLADLDAKLLSYEAPKKPRAPSKPKPPKPKRGQLNALARARARGVFA